MHDYLRCIGFSDIRTPEEEDGLLREVLKNPTERFLTESEGHTVAEFRKEFGTFTGIAVRGQFDHSDHFRVLNYYPYFTGNGITTREEIDVEKHSSQDTYAGVLDDIRIGTTIIFFLQNSIPYLKFREEQKRRDGQDNDRDSAETYLGYRNIKLSALSKEGKILLPVLKESGEENGTPNDTKSATDREKLIAAARDGDEEAIESLTLDDIDQYTILSERVQNEDILSIVESTFMPNGIESEEYYMIGEIHDAQACTNPMTGEKLWHMTIDCNDMIFDLCIAEKDLMGEPAPGRRFKGTLWLQGEVEFE